MKHKYNIIIRHIFVCCECKWEWEQPFDPYEDWEVRCPACKSTAPIEQVEV